MRATILNAEPPLRKPPGVRDFSIFVARNVGDKPPLPLRHEKGQRH